MNSFELRQKKRRAIAAKHREDRAFARTLETAGVQSFFEDAFRAVYGKASGLTHRSGWFHLQGKRFCKAEIMKQANVLYAIASQPGAGSD